MDRYAFRIETSGVVRTPGVHQPRARRPRCGPRGPRCPAAVVGRIRAPDARSRRRLAGHAHSGARRPMVGQERASRARRAPPRSRWAQGCTPDAQKEQERVVPRSRAPRYVHVVQARGPSGPVERCRPLGREPRNAGRPTPPPPEPAQVSLRRRSDSGPPDRVRRRGLASTPQLQPRSGTPHPSHR